MGVITNFFKKKKKLEPIRKVQSSTMHGKMNNRDVEHTDDGFVESVAMGMISNNGIVGGLMGGNMMGGIVGDMLNDGCIGDCDSNNDSYDSSDSCDSGSSDSDCGD